MTTIAIAGAGQAGAALAAKLRGLGFDGRIRLFGAEPVAPYQRPPLSKKYLMGEMGVDRLLLRPERFYSENRIELALGRPVTAIDRDAKTVRAGDEVVAYDHLVLATGASPRRLPAAIGGDLPEVHTVRNLADIDRMAPAFRPGRRLLVVGGGYIGLEAAAVAAGLGLTVSLLEAAPRILQRVAAPETSDFFRALHRDNGIAILEHTGLERLEPAHPGLTARLSDRRVIEADFAIIGIGVAANDALAVAAGLETGGGIRVDAMGRTSDPAIWAAGDCACLPFRGAMIRLESVQNAVDQAEAVAANIMGADVPYDPKPWFWSDQFDVKLQIAGLNAGYDSVAVRHGERANARSHWYYRGEQLLAVDAMNDARSYMLGKRLIERGISPPRGSVAAPDADLKAYLG
ncbi:FAD-dependent oxidoreductase [Aquibium sp. A9E412]|uniref:NAD(P)/FAD-dependent oxidoreductase n=1 Tax=Aquibium sp. A9E412 TaxID=2976767 RepID=UPI0025B06466|nr:FAD-dependent oxidoreductase [Aquibium sp. A9E412]MDN2564605.1 FAD-dependent oxidoreductase [Aquibium sp. A9E412]